MPEFPSSPASAREGSPRPSWLYILVFAAGSLLIVALTGFHLLERKKASLAYWRDQQFTIVDDRARLISNWLGERRADGELLALYPSVPGLLGAVRARIPAPASLRLNPCPLSWTSSHLPNATRLFTLSTLGESSWLGPRHRKAYRRL